MNEKMVETLKIMDIFEVFKKYEEEGPTNLKDMDWFIPALIKNGYPQAADFIEEWTVCLRYYMDREHDDSDNYYLQDTQKAS